MYCSIEKDIINYIKYRLDVNKKKIEQLFSILNIHVLESSLKFSQKEKDFQIEVNIIVEFLRRKSLVDLVKTEVALSNLLKMKIDVLTQDTIEQYLLNKDTHGNVLFQGTIQTKINISEVKYYAKKSAT